MQLLSLFEFTKKITRQNDVSKVLNIKTNKIYFFLNKNFTTIVILMKNISFRVKWG